MMKTMEGKVVLITGGGGGIARGISSAFAEEGANLVLTDIVQPGMDKTKEEVESAYGVQVVTCIANGAKEDDVKKAIALAIEKFGRLDTLINNATGPNPNVSLLEEKEENFEVGIRAGLIATFFYMKHAYEYLKETKGSIINFASGSGIRGGLRQASYGATKEGIRAISRVAAREWGQDGINVNIIVPLVETPVLKKWSESNPDLYEKVVSDIPMRRFADAKDDIGRVCVFLASDAAKYLTGETLSLEGGRNMRP